jgi:hypothetical protein
MSRENDSDLSARAAEAARDERCWEAAFLYEQARKVALDGNRLADAYRLGTEAAHNWANAGQYERELAMLLDLLRDVPLEADPVDVYFTRLQKFFHYLDLAEPSLPKIEAERIAATAAYEELRPGGSEGPYLQGRVAFKRGRMEQAYAQFEISYARYRPDGMSTDKGFLASRAALAALHLDRLADARLWIDKIESSNWPLNAQIHRAARRLQVALQLRDIAASRDALLALDSVLTGVQRALYAAQVCFMAVSALCLDPAHGDPGGGHHPAERRIQDFPAGERKTSDGQWSWSLAVLAWRLAALRYAAGLPTDEDYWSRPPHEQATLYAPRLPAELISRLAAARAACYEAAEVAGRLDQGFECSLRQREVNNTLQRIEDIAASHGLEP